ncbi:toll/interleukin-1 receptor domain-containing protein [Nostoc sp. ChiVER01]|uniref:toll/interleukin-1 receptor domain-containing protein n=1 Tax=Nostoc sp. ChiVER01 TaxID=3075382 RepID=UPI002AD5502F|nr:toll/interleukin-1 receptor domain-containing protein [Nostoc sp. ChiVER01]MDZ8221529.1 toll/interleukin-1 receptor domain-containing protein [Nostoc sp. ChiVER01]
MATIFFSYSHRDETLRDELEVHLAMLKRQGFIEMWHDRRITAGEEFDKAISKNLEEADIILLLVSSDFLASNYCYDIEMQRAMEKHEKGESYIIPIILRPCDWRSAPFGKLLVMPTDGKPITKFPDKDDAFLEVVNAIKGTITRLKLRQDSTSPSISYGSAIKPQILDIPRSSNLRIRKTFLDRDRDQFVEESFEYISNFFENSLAELSNRNLEVDTHFKRIDANHFSAIVYIRGKKATECRIWIRGSSHLFTNGIAYSSNASGSDNSINESISIVDDGYALFLQPLGMAFFASQQNVNKLLSQQGASEYFWDILLRPLQQGST